MSGFGSAPDADANSSPSEWGRSLAALLPGPGGAEEAASFAARVPASYKERTPPEEAALDVANLSTLGRMQPPDAEGAWGRSTFGGQHLLAVRPDHDANGGAFRIRRYGERGIELTRFLPVLESFGLVVVESVPYLIRSGAAGQPAVHLDDLGVRIDSPYGPEALRFVPDIHGPRLVAALEALARGDTEVDSLNRLVTAAGLDWRQVTVLRAYLRYQLQGRTSLSPADLADPLVAYPDVARGLIGYFQARFDPEAGPSPDRRPPGLPGSPPPRAPPPSVSPGAGRPEAQPCAADAGPAPPDVGPAQEVERGRCLSELDLVPALRQDQVLRGYLRLIDATLRTNYFQVDSEGRHHRVLTLKLDSAAVPDLPAPRPKVEAFVHGPSVEGIHLRAGLIARGGLRWSERPLDFRTEVLDLAFAQVKKNAIIVPTGAKGGFVCRRPGAPGGMAGYSPEDVQASYQAFVRALLDVTDNLVSGEVVHPARVVAWDGPDPYLVVAADKGTATFSDLANDLSDEYHFWLGDAFASGGSRGYDHKAMGITARGAWVAVRCHFHQLGIDVQTDPIRVAGVGDMSGDVFGNGMLQSRAIRLVAAFDHRHIFLDPDPDPSSSFVERRRLASLPRSSWADYRSDLISEGGGVWPRDAKTVPLAASVQRALGVSTDRLSPPQLVAAILGAPVDLLWFGGIGTFVKAPEEANADVGDRADDDVRITSDQLRARVVAEGGNLGVTQLARIRYSRRGGRINTDFIDNAAGVATSDREVNCKILLALAIEQGRLDPAERDGYLARSENEVAAEVLRQVDHSVAALSRAVPDSAREFDAYAGLVTVLEESGRLDRTVECLPSPDELQVRREAGAGFIRPELAVLLAYAKSDLVAALGASDVVDDPALLDAVVAYFPAPIREPFGQLIPQHRLYAPLVATDVAGELVDQLGIVWAHETAAELGRDVAEVAAAFWAARQVVGAGERWAELEQRSGDLSADAEAALHDAIRNAVAALARAYLIRPGGFRLGEALGRDGPWADTLVNGGPGKAAQLEEDRLVALGVDQELAERFVRATARAGIGEAGPVAVTTGRSVAEAAEALQLVGRAAALDRLADAVDRASAVVPAPSRLTAWQGRALLDDLHAWQRAAASAALAGPGSIQETVAAWEAAHEPELARAALLSGSTSLDGADPMAVTALVLRRLRLAV